MKIIVVDGVKKGIDDFMQAVGEAAKSHEIIKFQNPNEALKYVEKEKVDLAFVHVCMEKMDGVLLGKQIKMKQPKTLVMFISASEQEILRALKAKGDYYILKPYAEGELASVLEKTAEIQEKRNPRVYIRTFGRFDLFVNGEVVYISNTKAKELLALCVDHRGGNVTMEEAIDKLWEDRAYDEKVKNLYRKAVTFLNHLFKKYEIRDVFLNHRGSCHIDPKKIKCDFYEYLETGKVDGLEFHNIEKYLTEYSWAEMTIAQLKNIKM